MKALVQNKRGKAFNSMFATELPSPVPEPHEIKVKMAASRINPVDLDLLKGFPGIAYNTPQIGGVDGAGQVVEVGSNVEGFKPGDVVFFYRMFSDFGTWAEEVVIDAAHAACIPQHFNATEAGALALPLLTAYEGLMELSPQQGERILIHGAGGGVGFQAVCLALALGLEVVANASPSDRTALETVGVQQFIDYKSEDFVQVLANSPVDWVFDVVGKETLLKSIGLRPKAVVSTTLPDVAKMHKTGVKLSGFFKVLMKLMTRKPSKLAKKQGVSLIGQVTGANGTGLKEAAILLEKGRIPARAQRNLAWERILSDGLQAGDVGKIIVF